MAPPITTQCKGPPCHDPAGCTVAGSCRYVSSADEFRELAAMAQAGEVLAVPDDLPFVVAAKIVADFTGKVDGGGYKAVMDNPKDPLELIPPQFLLALAAVLQHGKVKYAANNWMRGMSFTVVFGSILRHLFAWFAGRDTDKESGLPHLHHAACGLMFLIFFTTNDHTYSSFDDRVFK